VDTEIIDRRPDPKPRKHPHLWQSYCWWDELMQIRKKHVLRRTSAERGKSNYDAQLENEIMEAMALEVLIKRAQSEMVSYGKAAGPIWDWLVAVRGIGDHTAAKLISLIDDPANFATISKLWRFSGYGLMNGKIDRPTKGETLPYNRRLKSELRLLAEQFYKQQTPIYGTIYYEEKERQRRLNPQPLCSKCSVVAGLRGQTWTCPKCRTSGISINYTPLHLHCRAMRKAIKIFLSHLWLVWREADGLPISDPYVIAMLRHEHYIEPPRVLDLVS